MSYATQQSCQFPHLLNGVKISIIMKQILLLAILFSFNQYNFAQNAKVAQYWHWINLAEMHLVNADYTAALICYDSAFALQIIHEGIDYSNASLAAIYTKDFLKVKEYCASLAQLGVEWGYFNHKTVYQPFRASVHWRDFEAHFPQNYEIGKARKEQPFRKKLDSLLIRDQSLRSKVLRPGITQAMVRSLDDSVFMAFSELVKINGYPNDASIGVQTEDTTFFNNIDVITRHAYQNGDFSLTKVLKQNLFDGNVSPGQFKSWHEFELPSKQIRYWGQTEPYLVINNHIYFDGPNPLNMDTINTNRKSLMLSSYSNLCEKILFIHVAVADKRDSDFEKEGLLTLAIQCP
jgi:hypothetical protein